MHIEISVILLLYSFPDKLILAFVLTDASVWLYCIILRRNTAAVPLAGSDSAGGQ